MQGHWLSFFLFLFSTYKSWHPEGTCGLSQRAEINKTSAISSYKSNLMRSNRGMCGRNSWTCQLFPSAFEIMTRGCTVVDRSMIWERDLKKRKRRYSKCIITNLRYGNRVFYQTLPFNTMNWVRIYLLTVCNIRIWVHAAVRMPANHYQHCFER